MPGFNKLRALSCEAQNVDLQVRGAATMGMVSEKGRGQLGVGEHAKLPGEPPSVMMFPGYCFHSVLLQVAHFLSSFCLDFYLFEK